MAVGPQQDLHPGPVGAELAHEAAQKGADLASTRPLGRAQHSDDEPTLAVEHHDGLEAILVVVRIEQAHLLSAVHGVERVVHVQHDPARHLAEQRAIQVDHGLAHAQQRARAGQVLQARDGRLRAQRRLVPKPRHGQLEHWVGAQPVGVVAVLVASRNHQQAEADDLVKAMHDALWVAWIPDAGRQPFGHVKALLHLAQHQQPAIGAKVAAVEAGDHRLSAHR